MLARFVPLTRYPYTGKATDCLVCGSADHARIARIDHKFKRLDTHLCGDCGLFFTCPMPTDDELSTYYASAYRAEYRLAFRRPDARHLRIKEAQATLRSDRIEGLQPGKTLRTLDFGCGAGQLVRHLAARGHDAHGLEPGDSFGEYASNTQAGEQGGTIRVTDWRTAGYAPHGNRLKIIDSDF